LSKDLSKSPIKIDDYRLSSDKSKIIIDSNSDVASFNMPILGTTQVVSGTNKTPVYFLLPRTLRVISNELNPDPKLVEAVNKNITYLESRFPGLKIFGSARGVSVGLPHIPGDFDGIMTINDFNKVKSQFNILKELKTPSRELRGYRVQFKDVSGDSPYTEMDIGVL